MEAVLDSIASDIQVQERSGYIWAPQEGPQTLAVICPADIILYGGARGGGKTDCILGRQIIGALRYGTHWSGLIIHKNYKNFKEIRKRLRELKAMGIPLSMKGGPQQTNYITLNGAEIVLTAIQRAEELDQFQGHQYTEIDIEEGGKFAFIAKIIDELKGCLRSPQGVPVTMFITANPGGPGHLFLRMTFVDPGKNGFVPIPIPGKRRPMVAMYIPAKVYDNKILCRNDPGYVDRLESISDPDLRRAWLEGDWYVVPGGFFGDIWKTEKVVIPKFQPPRTWSRLFSMDWGSARPFSVGWYTMADGSKVKGLPPMPRGSLVRYAEWYGCVKGKSDVGLRMESVDVGRRIVELERARSERDLHWDRVADPAMFSSDDGPSVAEKLAGVRIVLRKADNARIPGWDECRFRLRNGLFYVTENCRSFISIVPTLPRDDDNWEDLDTTAEDHIADEWRYACMARPQVLKRQEETDRYKEARRWENTVLDPYAGY